MPTSLNVLVIDDEPALRQILAAAVSRAGHTVDTAAGVVEATAKLKAGDIDVALCDIKMPDGNGIDLLRQSQAAGLDTVFVMVTAFASLETAVEALRAGAFDYIVKPVRNQEIMHRLGKIQEMRGLRKENSVLRNQVMNSRRPVFRFGSPSMLEIERLAGKVAPTDSTVLIVGESGTGKGVLAHLIHDQSPRCDGPFVPVNCSAIPEQLIESEFFGHTKGAFTGADKVRKGLFAAADGGTLFLDEIGELPLLMQTKLLHAIEDKQVRAVGSEKALNVNFRIVAATNRNLADAIHDGKFREDLFFRLSMFQLALPPLRDRLSDIPDLARFLLEKHRSVSGSSPIVKIDPAAQECLLHYDWPGNVREFDNVIQRAQILCDGDCITVADLPVHMKKLPTSLTAAAAASEGGLREQLRRFEASLIRQAIDAAAGDRKQAAQALGISLSSLYNKLGVEPGQKQET